MSTVKVEKGKLIATLDNGKIAYYDINTGKCFGVSGREIKKFNTEVNNLFMYGLTDLYQLVYRRGLNQSCMLLADKITNAYNDYTRGQKIAVYDYVLNTNTDFGDFCKRFKKIEETFKTKQYPDWFAIRSLFNDLDKEELKKSLTCSDAVANYFIESLTYENRAKVKKYLNKIDYLMEHEYLVEFFDMYTGRGWGANSNHIDRIFNMVIKYLDNCALLEAEPVWKNFLKMASVAQREAELVREAKYEDKIREYQNSKPLKYENDTFEVIIPYTMTDFKKEADYQQNCVFAYYYPKVKDGVTHVVFIRRKDKLDTPYITCEVTNMGRINQYLTRFNKSVYDADAKEFYAEYRRHLDENWYK